MQQNGSLCMYSTRKIITSENKLANLPNTLYKMKNIHDNGSGEKGSDHVSCTNTNKYGIITEQKLEDPHEITALLERQEKILYQLDELRQQMINLKTDLSTNNERSAVVAEVLQSTFACPLEVTKSSEIVINASPSYPPYSILLLKKLCRNILHLQVTSHVHSSVASNENVEEFLRALESYTVDHKPIICIRLIWKNVGPNTELILAHNPIIGEVNILRYFSRIIPNVLKYETAENCHVIDDILDTCHSFVMSKSKAEQSKLLQSLNGKLGKSNWFCGFTNISIADVATYSVIRQAGSTVVLTPNLSKWFERCASTT